MARPGVIIIAGLLMLLLLAVACRGSEPETVAPSTATPHAITTQVSTPQASPTAMPTLALRISPTTIPTPAAQASLTAMPTPSATPWRTLTPAATVFPTATSPSLTIAPDETEDGVAVPAGGSWTQLALEVFSTMEIACLIGESEPLDIDAFGDWPRSGKFIFVVPSETLSSCIQPERNADISVAYMERMVGGFSSETERCIGNAARDFQTQSGSFLPASFIVNSIFFADTCLNESEYIEYEVGHFSFEAGGLDSQERDCVRQLKLSGGELIQVTLFPNILGWPWHPAFHCLSYDKIVELKVHDFAVVFGFTNSPVPPVPLSNLQYDQLDCVRTLYTQTESLGQSIDTFDSGTMAGRLFMGAAALGCFTYEEMLAYYVIDPAQSDTAAIDCVRQLYAEKFPILLREEVGEKMFRTPDELSPQELEFVQSFFASPEECEEGS